MKMRKDFDDQNWLLSIYFEVHVPSGLDTVFNPFMPNGIGLPLLGGEFQSHSNFKVHSVTEQMTQ